MRVSRAAVSPPRSPERGPVEAIVLCLHRELMARPLRALRSAAPLKPKSCRRVVFNRHTLRALRSAAPLKPVHMGLSRLTTGTLRALRSAAPLKHVLMPVVGVSWLALRAPESEIGRAHV